MLLRNSLFSSPFLNTSGSYTSRVVLRNGRSRINRFSRVHHKRSFRLYSSNTATDTATASATANIQATSPSDFSPSLTGEAVYGIAFHSPTWTRFLGDIMATEAELPVSDLTTENLHNIYVKQYEDYVAAKDTLKKENVSDGAYEGLRRILQLRVDLPSSAIDKALHISGINDLKKRGFKGNFGAHFSDEGHVDNTSGYFSSLRKARKSGFSFKRSFVKNLLSGLTGLVQAIDKGFTTDQLKKGKTLLGSESGEIVQMDTPTTLVSTTARDKYQERLALLKQGKITEAFPEPADLNAQEKETYDAFIKQQTEFWKDPENAEADLEFTQLVVNADMSNEKIEEFFNIFADKKVNDDEDVIKRITCFNPVAEALLANNIVALAVPGLNYTDDYIEYSGGKLVYDEDPANTPGRKNWNETELIYNANVGYGEPRVAAEQIMQMKLERLASFYGLNLENDLDNVKFHMFMEQYEVSPGEYGLDFLLTYPPDAHTFDELPIVKIPSDENVEDYYRSQ